MMTTFDEDLWAGVLSGDSSAFGTLFDRHANSIYSYCFRRTADWALAEDLTSIVFLETWRRRNDVQLKDGALLPWLYGVATNVIRNHRRSIRRYHAALRRVPRSEPEPDFAGDLTDRHAGDATQMRDILAAVGRLPAREQDVLALCVWQELTGAEAAAALGVPESTIRSRLFRARKRLRQAAAPDSPDLNSTLEGSEP